MGDFLVFGRSLHGNIRTFLTAKEVLGMKPFFQHILIYCFIFISSTAIAQDIPVELRAQIEAFVENAEADDIDLTQIIDVISTYLERPFDLNQVSAEDIAELGILTAFQIEEFIQYRELYGPFLEEEELQVIPGIDPDLANLLASIGQIKGEGAFHVPLHKMAYQGSNELYTKWIRVLEPSVGFDGNPDKNRYLGDPNKYTVRYKYSYENRLRYGLLLEKDQGEEFFRGSNRQGFDYMSGYVYLKDRTPVLKDVIIGDYTVSMGQGLIAHNDFASGKSAWVTNVKKGGRTIRPYGSVNENLYNRGLAATLNVSNKIEASLFGSMARKDGTILAIDTVSNDIVDLSFSSFFNSGYHRTPLDIQKEKTLTELKYGSVVKYKGRYLKLGLNYQHQEYNSEFSPVNALYNAYRFRGNSLDNLSLDYSLKYKNFLFYGESAHSLGSGFANIHGLLMGLDRKTSLALIYRKYDIDYHVINPNAFGERTAVANEQGLYLGLDIKPNYHWQIRAYGDIWRHPWLKFQTDSPTTGKEYLVRIDYKIKRKLNAYVLYFNERKFDNINLDQIIDPVTAQRRQKMRLHISYNISKAILLRSRYELSWFNQSDQRSKGYLLFQDIVYKPIESPIEFSTRLAFFNTDDYNSRIYAYENDLLYEFYIPAYFYKGSRYYLNLRYRGIRNVLMEFRYGYVQYDNRDIIGSGLNLIEGNKRTELKAQVKYKF